MGEDYKDVVGAIEGELPRFAKRSFEDWSPQFVDGGDVFEHYHQRWRTAEGRAALANRTPVQLERDRILYSPGLRKQAEKYHVLYNGQRRIVRNFATHTMRCAQVSRAIARGLRLNEDFAEAIALGSKVGATPFVHAAKEAVDQWLREKIAEIDASCSDRDDQRERQALFDGDLPLPNWIEQIESTSTFEAVKRQLPWAHGSDVEKAYTSGQQSYWSLCCQPFTLEAMPSQFQPESMFGIWRHSRGLASNGTQFRHEIVMEKASDGRLRIDGGAHATFEAIVVQYADDITWAIENLDDANSAALLNNRSSVYQALMRELAKEDLPTILTNAISANDAGGFYTYFITDFVGHSAPVLAALEGNPGEDIRAALGAGEEEAAVGLSPRGAKILAEVIDFLHAFAFEEPRVRNRKKMLAEVSRQCVHLLYEGDPDSLRRFIEDRANLEQWPSSDLARADELLQKSVHRAQAAVSVFASMADQEIYDFVGIQSL